MVDDTSRPPGTDDDTEHHADTDPALTATGHGVDAVPRTIHDAFFKDLFGDPRNAASLLRAISPLSIAEHLDWTTLRPAHASVVHEQYRQTHGDLMFEARWKDGTDRSTDRPRMSSTDSPATARPSGPC